MMERGDASQYLNQAYLAALQLLKESSSGGFTTFSLTESGDEGATTLISQFGLTGRDCSGGRRVVHYRYMYCYVLALHSRQNGGDGRFAPQPAGTPGVFMLTGIVIREG